jgi:hypothetical protein
VPDCPYRQCELTYRTGAFGGRLEVGEHALTTIGGGFGSGGIVRAMSAVPEAARIARRGRVAQVTASTLRVLVVAGTVVGWHAAGRSLDPPLARLFIGAGGVLYFGLVPFVPQSIAHGQFQRATEVYNRELGR